MRVSHVDDGNGIPRDCRAQVMSTGAVFAGIGMPEERERLRLPLGCFTLLEKPGSLLDAEIEAVLVRAVGGIEKQTAIRTDDPIAPELWFEPRLVRFERARLAIVVAGPNFER